MPLPAPLSTTTQTRTNGPCSRSNGRQTNSVVGTPTSTTTAAWTFTRWNGCPSTASNVVRKLSCRATNASTAPCKAATSTGAGSDKLLTVLYTEVPGSNCAMNHNRCWPKETVAKSARALCDATPPSGWRSRNNRSTTARRAGDSACSRRARGLGSSEGVFMGVLGRGEWRGCGWWASETTRVWRCPG